MTDQFFFLDYYNYDSNEIYPEYTDYLNSLSDEELLKELFFVKHFFKSFINVSNHCCSIYKLNISEKIIDMIKSNRCPSQTDLLDINHVCKEMVDYLNTTTLSKDKNMFENYPDYWGYFSGFSKELMIDHIIETTHNCASFHKDYNYAIYRINLIIGKNDYVLGKEVTDEYALNTINNASAANGLKTLGIVKTEEGYDLMERVKHIEMVLDWLFYTYLEL